MCPSRKTEAVNVPVLNPSAVPSPDHRVEVVSREAGDTVKGGWGVRHWAALIPWHAASQDAQPWTCELQRGLMRLQLNKGARGLIRLRDPVGMRLLAPALYLQSVESAASPSSPRINCIGPEVRPAAACCTEQTQVKSRCLNVALSPVQGAA